MTTDSGDRPANPTGSVPHIRLALSAQYVLGMVAVLGVLVTLGWYLRAWPPVAMSIEGLKAVFTSWLAPYVYLILGLLFLTWLVAEGVNKFAKNKAAAWSAPLQPYLHVATNDQPQFGSTLNLEESEKQRLRAQYMEIQSRLLHHIRIMAEFFANYYMAINMVSILGAVSGICLFYIANKGWTDATKSSPFVVAIGVYATVAGAYYLSFATVFKQQQNISDNKALYLQYVALGNELLSYCATGTSDAVPSETPQAYIRRMDKRMAAINNIAIGFDYTKIVDYKHVLTTSLQTPGQQQPQGDGGQGVPQRGDQSHAQVDTGEAGKDQNGDGKVPAAGAKGTVPQSEGEVLPRQPGNGARASVDQPGAAGASVQTRSKKETVVATEK